VRLNAKEKTQQTSSRMTGISDAVVIGVVLGLIFAAVSYYIYSRTTQIERKVGLIENILLDLKVTTEQALLNATDAGDSRGSLTQDHSHEEEQEDAAGRGGAIIVERLDRQEQRGVQQDDSNQQQQETRDVVVDQAPRGRQPAQPIVVEREAGRETAEQEGNSVTTNYELMTYKELTALAKKLGISGLRNQSKAFVIEAIRSHEQNGGASGSGGSVGVAAADDSAPTRSGQSNLTQWATGTVSFQDGAVNPLNDSVGAAPGAMNAVLEGAGDGAPLGDADVETSLVA
jgi:hypothetical protein